MKKLSLFLIVILILGCEESGDPPAITEDTNKLNILNSVNCEPLNTPQAPSTDISPPAIVRGTIEDGGVNVDPEALNQNGISYEFDEPIDHWIIDLKEIATCRGSPARIRTLDWNIRWDTKRHVTLTPPERRIGVAYNASSFFLRYDTVYLLDIFVVDGGGYCSEGWVIFRTRQPD